MAESLRHLDRAVAAVPAKPSPARRPTTALSRSLEAIRGRAPPDDETAPGG
jgi:hypothetical protein